MAAQQAEFVAFKVEVVASAATVAASIKRLEDVVTKSNADATAAAKSSADLKASDGKRMRTSAQPALQRSSSPAPAQGADETRCQRSRSTPPDQVQRRELLSKVRMRVKPVDKDGSCFFHSLAVHFAHAKLDITSAAVIRAEVVSHLKLKEYCLQTWLDPWAKYVWPMRCGSAWGEELEGLSAACRFGLRINVARMI